MRESRTYGSVRGAASNSRPYRYIIANPCPSLVAVPMSHLVARCVVSLRRNHSVAFGGIADIGSVLGPDASVANDPISDLGRL